MSRRLPGAVTLVIAVAAGVLAAPVHATPARTASLAGHPFMPDDTDVLRFPSTALRSAGLLTLSHGDDVGPLGEVGALIGETFVGGVFLGTSGGAADLARRADVFAGSGIVVPPRLADVVLAYTPHPGQTVGLSAGMSHSLTRNSNADAGDNGVLAASFGIALGHSYDGPLGSVADTSIGLDFSYFRRTQRFEVTHEAPIIAAFDLRHRSLWTLAPRWQIGSNVRLRRDDLSLQMPAAERSASGQAWTVDAEVGPRLQPTERVTLAMSARFASTWWDVDGFDAPPQTGDQGSESTTTFPGFRVAAEARLTDWAVARMGFVGGLVAVRTDDGDGNEATVMGRQLAWTTGLGLQWENLHLDGRLQAALLKEGPDAVGGQAPGLFSTVSVSYAF